jgi:TolB-like protein/Tfp pilus assembly protein PilF
MKRCPQCNRVEPEDTLAFCRADGTALVSDSSPPDREAGATRLGSAPVATEIETSILPHTTDSAVKRATAPTTVLPTQSAPSATGKLIKRWYQQRLVIALASLIIIAVVIGGYLYVSRKNSTSIGSIAVLPFVNASGNADNEYLSDGVSESVIDRLSQLPQLKVIARSSSFRYRGQNLNLQEIANTLGVDAIVTGRVVQRDDSYLIRVDVTDVRENKQLWGENFTRKISDVQALQTDISREIAENLRLRLSGTQQQQLVKQQTTNPQAYELVLKGIFYREKGGAENLKKSIECFQQATAIDPNYALAYAGLADSYRFAGGDPKRDAAEREAAVHKALELDDNLGEAHFTMGMYKRDLWQWQEAEREFKRAIEINPGYAHAHSGYSGLLSLLGRHDEAIAEDKRATELDPVGGIINTVVGRTLHFARRYDEAIVHLKQTIELNQNSPFAHLRLGDVYVTKGVYREAINEYRLAIKLGDAGSEVQIRLGAAYARTGDHESARAILKGLQANQKYVPLAQLAVLYAALDEREQAFASLEKAYAEHSPSVQFLKVDPVFDPLRSDPRFQDLLVRMGLPT